MIKPTVKDWIYTGIIVILMSIIVFSAHRPSSKEMILKHAIDSLSEVSKGQSLHILMDDKLILIYGDSINKINTIIQNNDEKIKTLYKSYNISIRHVDTLSIGGIKSYITDRYHPKSEQ